MKITVTGGDEIGKALSKLASPELRQKITRLVVEELQSMSELAFRSARFRPTEVGRVGTCNTSATITWEKEEGHTHPG